MKQKRFKKRRIEIGHRHFCFCHHLGDLRMCLKRSASSKTVPAWGVAAYWHSTIFSGNPILASIQLSDRSVQSSSLPIFSQVTLKNPPKIPKKSALLSAGTCYHSHCRIALRTTPRQRRRSCSAALSETRDLPVVPWCQLTWSTIGH